GKFALEEAQVDERIDGPDLLGRTLQLGAADVVRGVDDLTLKICEVHHVEVDETEGTDASGGKVKGERRAETACTDAQYACSFEPLLPFHADLGQDEVARVAENLVVGEGRELLRFGGARHSGISDAS